jgi:hypothetical protein
MRTETLPYLTDNTGFLHHNPGSIDTVQLPDNQAAAGEDYH